MKLVFVSSTFRDMQHERDAINSLVAPRLDAFLEKYAESVHFGDLRWGVNTTELEGEESSKKVLSVCLDQIDDARPYMIVLIGERYGWIPAYELLHQAAVLKGIDQSIIDESTSVTNLEIEYGALLNPDYEGRVLFYFRKPLDTSKMPENQRKDYECESSLHRQKMDDLKAKILDRYPNYVRYYDAEYDPQAGAVTGLEPLCEMIYNDLVKIFDLDLTYISSLPNEKRALLSSQKHFEKLYESSYKRDISYLNDFDIDEIEYFYEARYEHNPVLELVQGENGAGAKTAIAQEYSSCLENEENAICFSFGLDERTKTLEQFKHTLVYALEEYLELEHSGDITTKGICDLFDKYTHDQSLPYLRIFAINAPKSIVGFLSEVSVIMPNLFGIGFHIHTRFLLNLDTPLPFFPKSIVTDVPELEKKEAREVIYSVLKSKRKELPEIVIKEMVKHKGSKSPLYLALLTQRLVMLDYEDFAEIRRMGDGMDNINKYMISLIKKTGDNIKDISKELLFELVQRINPEMAKHLIAHMTKVFHLNEKGIMELFSYADWNYSALDYAVFKRTFPSLMYEDTNGMLFFANDDIRTGAIELVRELGCEKDIDISIEYLKTKSHKYRRKALGFMLYEKGDACGMLDEYLPYIDIPQELASDSKAKEGFIACMGYLNEILNDAWEKHNDEFVVAVIEEIFTRAHEVKIANPYALFTYLLEFINPDFSNLQEVSRALNTLIYIILMAEEINQDNASEPLSILIDIMYNLYLPAYIGMATTKEQAEFFAKNYVAYKKAHGGISEKTMRLVAEGKMNLARAGDRSFGGAFQVYRTLRCAENPTREQEFELFSKLCTELEEKALARDKDYYSSILEGKYISNDYAEILFVGMNAYRYLQLGEYTMARVCYYAFYLFFDNKIKNEGIDSYFLTSYMNLLCDMCNFLINSQDRIASVAYNEVLDFAMITLARHTYNVNLCAEVMEIILLGRNNDLITNSADYCYLPLEIAIKRLKNASNPDTIAISLEFFEAFDFIFNDEERSFYFTQLLYGVADVQVSAGCDDRQIITYLAEKTYCYLQDKDATIEICMEIANQLVIDYEGIFVLSEDEYEKIIKDAINKQEE